VRIVEEKTDWSVLKINKSLIIQEHIETHLVQILINNRLNVDLINKQIVNRLKLLHQSVTALPIRGFTGEIIDKITHFS
jgi:hypothetical protein